jgi:hypothetical protein
LAHLLFLHLHAHPLKQNLLLLVRDVIIHLPVVEVERTGMKEG